MEVEDYRGFNKEEKKEANKEVEEEEEQELRESRRRYSAYSIRNELCTITISSVCLR